MSGTPEPRRRAGVLMIGKTGVTVKNGRVRNFDAGVVIQNSSNNLVTGIVAEDNVGQSLGHPPAPGAKYGDGIALLGSSGNTIRLNAAQRNAPYSGIGIYERSDSDHPSFTTAPARNNLIEANNVLNNTGCRVGGTCGNDGIRVEPSSAGATGSGGHRGRDGLDGIALFGGVNGTQVTGNQVYRNSFNGSAAGDGIRVFGFANFITNNNTNSNRGAGISVAAHRCGLGLVPCAQRQGQPDRLQLRGRQRHLRPVGLQSQLR